MRELATQRQARPRRDPPPPELAPIPSAIRTSVRMVMDADWLRSRLESGRSIESIAREAGKAPVHRRLLGQQARPVVDPRATPRRPRPDRPRACSRRSSSEGLTIRADRRRLDRSPRRSSTGSRTHGLKTTPRALLAAETARSRPRRSVARVPGARRGRCSSARARRVATAARAATRKRWQRGGGGSRRSWSPRRAAHASLCGFDAYVGALQFHHRDPAEKAFSLSRQGVTRSLAAARAEARKCVLLCANCHAMVEAGLLLVPDDCRYSYWRLRGGTRSGVAQRQSIRLLTEGLWVRIPPPELSESRARSTPRGAQRAPRSRSVALRRGLAAS